jgi:hypothetical protein
MEFNTNKLYPVNIVFVKPWYRKDYQRHAILLKVDIPELTKDTTCTINLPKSLSPKKAKPNCSFSKVLGGILKEQYPDTLLESSKDLAFILNKDLSGKAFLARLTSSKDGKYIDLKALLPLPAA